MKLFKTEKLIFLINVSFLLITYPFFIHSSLSFLHSPVKKNNPEPSEPFHIFAAAGVVKGLKTYTSDPAFNVNFKDTRGNAALHFAAMNGRLDMVIALLTLNAIVDIKNNKLQTPFHFASQNNHCKVGKELLQRSANRLALDFHNSVPLHYAALGNSIGMVDLLLGSNRDDNISIESLNALNKTGQTPLSVAAEKGFKAVIAKLHSFGADINWADQELLTPLHFAVKNGHEEATKYLLRQGPVINARDRWGQTALHVAVNTDNNMLTQILLDSGADKNVKDNEGSTPLHCAATRGLTEQVKLLIKYEVELHILDNERYTPFHRAASEGHLKIVQLLHSDEKMDLSNVRNETALHSAARHGRDEVVGHLLARRSSCQVVDGKGYTPLHYAAYFGHHACVEQLVTYLAKVSARSIKGHIPLHSAALRGHPKIVDLLLLTRDPLNIFDAKNNSVQHTLLEDEEGNNALHAAARGGDEHVVKKILSMHPNVDCVNNKGQTPLHIATAHGHSDVVALLCANGANIDELDDEGNSVLHYSIDSTEEITQNVLLKFSSPSHCNSEGHSAFHKAAQKGKIKKIFLLAHLIDSINKPDKKGKTPLLLAIESGQTFDCFSALVNVEANVAAHDLKGKGIFHYVAENNCVGFMYDYLKETKKFHRDAIKYSRFINALDFEDNSPLYYAVKGGYIEMINCLIEAGAILNIVNKRGWSPTAYAFQSATLAVCEVLVDHGADMLARTNEGENLVHLVAQNTNNKVPTYCVRRCLRKGLNLNEADLKGNLPIHVAAKYGNQELISILQECNVFLGSTSRDGLTPLMLIAQENGKPTSSTLYNPLLRSFNTPEMISAQDGHAQTALHHAAAHKQVENIRWLVQQIGCMVDVQDVFKSTPLHVAAEAGDSRSVKLLLDRNANANDADHKGRTVLHKGVLSGSIDICRHLLNHLKTFEQKRALVNCSDKFGQPAFFLVANIIGDDQEALLELQKSMLRLFSEYECNFKVCDYSGKNLLYYLLKQGNYELASFVIDEKMVDCTSLVKESDAELTLLHLAASGNLSKNAQKDVEFLLRHRCPASIKDVRGRTPFYYAVLARRLDVCISLLQSTYQFVFEEDLEMLKDTEECISPFLLAYKTHQQGILNLLIAYGCQKYASNNMLVDADFKELCLSKVSTVCSGYNKWIVSQRFRSPLINLDSLESVFGKYMIRNVIERRYSLESLCKKLLKEYTLQHNSDQH